MGIGDRQQSAKEQEEEEERNVYAMRETIDRNMSRSRQIATAPFSINLNRCEHEMRC